MTDEFNPERARKDTILAIDRVAATVIANRRSLAEEILKRHPEASNPAMGPAAVNMALNILLVLRQQVETDPDLANADDVLKPGGTH